MIRITVEGAPKAGKTTVVELLHQLLWEADVDHVVDEVSTEYAFGRNDLNRERLIQQLKQTGPTILLQEKR